VTENKRKLETVNKYNTHTHPFNSPFSGSRPGEPVPERFFISRVLLSPPSPTSELRDRQLCGVVANRLQIVIMDTSRVYRSWSASVRSYRILMGTGPTGANLHDRCHDLPESGSA